MSETEKLVPFGQPPPTILCAAAWHLLFRDGQRINSAPTGKIPKAQNDFSKCRDCNGLWTRIVMSAMAPVFCPTSQSIRPLARRVDNRTKPLTKNELN